VIRLCCHSRPDPIFIEQMRASPEEKVKIYEGNARRLLKLKLPS